MLEAFVPLLQAFVFLLSKKDPCQILIQDIPLVTWKDAFNFVNGKIEINTYKDVELLIDLFDERYTKSIITGAEYDTDVKKLA